ncbi:hypothetical protein Pfl01_3332 [Pseudomonas fluorescens Pf0-1]|uniref:Uncharacterized protein n=2 Tax=Pseudomonas TaxID=286 RepID=Q3KAY4_PSEPF|nr:hypothetical protein Pfl01_3332 [Pseudomonas fluorescens Pf0-1]
METGGVGKNRAGLLINRCVPIFRFFARPHFFSISLKRFFYGDQMLDATLKIIKATRFDDVDHDLGYEYRGYNYEIQSEEDMFLIRIYDDEPGQAAVVRPTSMSKNKKLRTLVELLQSELGVSRVSLYKGDIGSYAEINLDSLTFLPA